MCFNGCPLQYTLNTGIVNRANIYLKHKKGYRVPVSVKSIPIYDDQKMWLQQLKYLLKKERTITLKKEYENLKDQLMKDQLTGIFNRRLFEF